MRTRTDRYMDISISSYIRRSQES